MAGKLKFINFHSIKSKLVTSFMVIIFLTISVLDTLLIFSLNRYYYDNIQEVLTKQAEYSGKFFNKYVSSQDLRKDGNVILESFESTTKAEVQIIDKNFNIMADSMEGSNGKIAKYQDVIKAIKGNPDSWTGNLIGSGEKVMAASYPLISNGKVLGAVRFISSLDNVEKIILKNSIIIILEGLAIIIIIGVICSYFASSIINPVNNITEVAKRMAAGDFKVKIAKQHDDEVGELGDAMNYMAEEILKNDKLKNEFISTVSHELRTPLTSITGWAITLRRSEIKDQESIDRGLEIIENESYRLAALVEELLDFSKLSGGKISLRLEEINIGELLKYVITQMTPRAERQGIEIVSDLEGSIPEKINADSNRLKQVLINILDNSIKFTPEKGKISITSYTSNGVLIICVKDTGIGISPEDLLKVKNKFYKSDKNSPGSGIGLAVCEEIIKLHGWTLNIQSIKNEGTEVTISLPL